MDPLIPRLERIEAELADVRRRLTVQQSPARAPVPLQVRLAKTVVNASNEYPTPGSATNCYWIVFVDDSAAAEVGHGTHTFSPADRQSAAAALCYNLAGGTPWLPEGTLLWVFSYGGRWYAALDAGPLQFELKTSLSPPAAGGSATAYLRSNGTTDTGVEFTVYDVLGQYYGRGNGTFSAPNDGGSCGVARFNPASGHWEISDLTPHALMICGETAAAVLSTDAHFHVGSATLEVMSPTGAIIVDQDPGNEAAFSIDNRHGWKLDEGAKFEAAWRQSGSSYKWVCIQADCPT